MYNIDLYGILQKPWLDVNDIMKVGCCGRDTAIKIRNDIIATIEKSGKKVPKGKTIVVPTQYIIEYFGIDIDYIVKMIYYEKNFNTLKGIKNYASVSK